MTAKKFSNALGDIAENYVDEAVTYSVNKKVAWINWASLAACFSLVVIAILLMHYLSPNIVTPPPTENGELPDGPYVFASADWPIYDNAEALVENADLVFIGKITDIDATKPQEFEKEEAWLNEMAEAGDNMDSARIMELVNGAKSEAHNEEETKLLDDIQNYADEFEYDEIVNVVQGLLCKK